MADLRVSFCGVPFRTPIVTASGTFGNGREYAEFFPLKELGGITSKAVTLLPRDGNPSPRTVETSSGMLNSIGLQNPGLRVFEREELPFMQATGTNVIVNVSGSTVQEYREIASALANNVDFLEINISCPNVAGEGMAFGQNPQMAAEVISAVKAVAGKSRVIAKLTPNVTDIVSIARAVQAAGADALSLINTLQGMMIDPVSGQFALAGKTGGLSGPAIFPVALCRVWQVAHAVDLPIIGMGGVSSGADVVAMMRAGATLVGVGTANFYSVDSNAPQTITRQLNEFCDQHGFSRVADLINQTSEIGGGK